MFALPHQVSIMMELHQKDSSLNLDSQTDAAVGRMVYLLHRLTVPVHRRLSTGDTGIVFFTDTTEAEMSGQI